MKKKGFTLIELLAVIVILSVVAIITIPMIMNVIEDSRREAFKDGIYSIFTSAELYVLETEQEITSSGILVSNLSIKNNFYKTGKIIKNNDNVLEVVSVTDGNYCANGTIQNIVVTNGTCGKVIPILNYQIDESNKILNVSIKDTMGIDSYSISEENKFDEENKVLGDGAIEIDFSQELTKKTTYYIYIKDTTGEITGLEAIEIPQSLFFENALDDKVFEEGESVNWSNLDWYVISDNENSVTLILQNNYDVGIYGESVDWLTSTVYEKLNNEFINQNDKILISKEEGSIIYNENISSYVRLPYNIELSTNIPNESHTAFWTMSNNGNQIYLGNANGENPLVYTPNETKNYYAGYSTSVTDIENEGIVSIQSDSLLSNPTDSSITYNSTATEVNRPTTYVEQTNVTAANAAGYGCSNSSCPNAYCGARTQSYYGDTCQNDSSFTYYVVQNWWNPNYNVSVSGNVCSSQIIYYANGNCEQFYELTSITSDIGYRPVVTVYKNK